MPAPYLDVGPHLPRALLRLDEGRVAVLVRQGVGAALLRLLALRDLLRRGVLSHGDTRYDAALVGLSLKHHKLEQVLEIATWVEKKGGWRSTHST